MSEEFNFGDRVVPVSNPDATPGVVTRVREGWRNGAADIEIQVEFRGAEWFYPYRACFKPNELAIIGHATPS
jgi:hypothetical protein